MTPRLEALRDWRRRRKSGRLVGHANSDRREWARDAGERREHRQAPAMPRANQPTREPEWVRRQREAYAASGTRFAVRDYTANTEVTL